jgi:hypothetical protein
MRGPALVTILLSVAMVSTAHGQATTSGMVSGRVFDDITTCPLRGAVLTAAGSSARTTTDAQGRYYLRGVPTTPFTLQVSLRGYAPQASENILATDPDTRVDFSLERAPSDSTGRRAAVRYPVGRCVLDRRDSLRTR